ncbi:hypothetical protein [Candidatus Absconditicoccus praedator]|uniref:hypothetical protein n=1 Tax=Candidatus Absconditicoccus praedator TaxID=2735562 RepID=UPI001E3AAA47|nr:hypothetical protein [Candidatus Absconditicoccus praedator]UFX83164.1 hypothetical protein HLG78_03455 [Candidatus Absconditicoccus praedator]
MSTYEYYYFLFRFLTTASLVSPFNSLQSSRQELSLINHFRVNLSFNLINSSVLTPPSSHCS